LVALFYGDIAQFLSLQLEPSEASPNIGGRIGLALVFLLLGATAYLVNRRTSKRNEALRISESRLRSLIASSKDGILAYDLNFRYTIFNHAMEKISGVKADTVLGRNAFEVFPFLSEIEEAEAFRMTVRGELAGKLEMPFDVPETGKSGFFESSHFPLRDQSGEVVGGMAIIRNITEQKSLEKQLITARRTAEDANAAKSSFLANMSHEIRTPLNGLVGLSSLLRETPLSDEQLKFTDGIQYCAETLRKITDEILDLSKIEADSLGLEPAVFNLATHLEEMNQILRPQARDKALEYRFQIDEKIPKILVGDSYRLRQILSNLIGNAIKFTESGFVQTEIRFHGLDDGQAAISFSIEDSGPGISKNIQTRIFESFVQADPSPSRLHSGAGLGLAISDRLVRMMGGQIQLQSQPGKGTKFEFSLKFKVSDEKALSDKKSLDNKAASTSRKKPGLDSISSASSNPQEVRKTTHVLVVDDDEIGRSFSSRLLSGIGCSVETAADGIEALKVLRQRNFDLVLMDIQMPLMDGCEVLRIHRQNEHIKINKNTPFVAVTAHAMPEHRAKCLKLGMAEHLSKPLSKKALEEFINGLQDTPFKNSPGSIFEELR
jgi:PAS domain S-box-containing protein